MITARDTWQLLQLLAAFIVMSWSVIHTFRTVQDATVRAQMRWVTFGVLFGFMGSVLGWTFTTLLGGSSILYTLFVLPMLLLPLSLAVAILRYRLFDIDFIIRRTLIYGAVSVLLALIFAGSVVALQTVFRSVTNLPSNVAVALSTLGIAALALPLRNRIQDVIDRRFYRQKYDAQKTLETFVAGLQNKTDLEDLAIETRAVIQETLQPTKVKVWLAADEARTLTRDEQEVIWLRSNDPILALMQHTKRIVEVDKLRLDSPVLHTMKVAATVLIAPLVNQDKVIGFITLGSRRSEQGYSADDYQLLTNLVMQAAPAFRVAELVREQREEAQQREQLEQELQVARLVQQTLLPKETLELEGWTVKTHYQPARAIGGDFYDFIRLPDGRVSIIIGDVTDKGTPAALVMAMTRTLLREATKLYDKPGEILAAVNDSLVGDIPEKMFVTCFYAVLEPVSGKLIYANAGHNVPYWRTGSEVKELHARGMPLGLMPGMDYEEKEMVMGEQDMTLFYTDGLVEAHDVKRNMLGGSKVKEFIASHAPSTDIVSGLLRYQAEFTKGDEEQEDDTTLIVLQRRNIHVIQEERTLKINPQNEKEWTVLTSFQLVTASGNERIATQNVEVAAKPLLSSSDLERLKTAVTEATMNALEHGNRNDKTKRVSVTVYKNAKQIAVHITDQGRVPIPEPRVPNLTAKLAGLQSPRGWGLFLIQNMVDEMSICSTEVGQTVELIVNLERNI